MNSELCRLFTKIFSIVCIIYKAETFCLPTNPIVVHGNASFEYPDRKTLVVTISENSYLLWKELSISEDETVHITQPSKESVLLIQTDENSSSSIEGILHANGHLILISPKGLEIGSSGILESDDLVVSTMPSCPCLLLNRDEEVYFQADSKAVISNFGRVKAFDGDVCLIGYQVSNYGAIDSSNGTVSLACGSNILMTQFQNRKTHILTSRLKQDNELTGIDISGMLTGRRIEIQADGNLYSVGLRQAGMINALGTETYNSEVFINTQNGDCGIFGAIAAENADASGGFIEITGKNLALFENSTIDASGDNGGGEIFLGREAHEDSWEAETVFIDEEVVISADAIDEGDGGTIVIGSRESTNFFGTISACGGEDFGDGGWIELFAQTRLTYGGKTDANAPNGIPGDLIVESNEIIHHNLTENEEF